jgi:hypothetical protein
MNSKVYTSRQAFRFDALTVEVGNLHNIACTSITVEVLLVEGKIEVNLSTWKELVAKVEEAINLSEENCNAECEEARDTTK